MVVVPATTPVTLPDASTVAMLVSPLDHVPPLTVLLSMVVEPTVTDAVPEMVPAVVLGFTDTSAVALSVPQLLLTV